MSVGEGVRQGKEEGDGKRERERKREGKGEVGGRSWRRRRRDGVRWDGWRRPYM